MKKLAINVLFMIFVFLLSCETDSFSIVEERAETLENVLISEYFNFSFLEGKVYDYIESTTKRHWYHKFTSFTENGIKLLAEDIYNNEKQISSTMVFSFNGDGISIVKYSTYTHAKDGKTTQNNKIISSSQMYAPKINDKHPVFAYNDALLSENATPILESNTTITSIFQEFVSVIWNKEEVVTAKIQKTDYSKTKSSGIMFDTEIVYIDYYLKGIGLIYSKIIKSSYPSDEGKIVYLETILTIDQFNALQ